MTELRLSVEPIAPWPLAAPPPSTAASLEVRARALVALEEHRAAMGRSAELLARSRALCRAAPERAPEPAPARPRLRLVPRDDDDVVGPLPGPTCMRQDCGRPAVLSTRLVLAFGTQQLSIAGLPLRVCDAHARDLDALTTSPQFLRELRARVRRRGAEPPRAIDVEFDPIH